MQKRAFLVILTALFALGVTAITAQTPTFRTAIDLATFGVTVVDKKGEYLADLNAEDFEIIEDGQKQTLRYFARGTDIENGPEVHVGLLFDTRGRTPDGETAMYDAMGVYLDGASEDDGRKILVLYTDGGDTHSTISFGDLMTLIRASDVTVYSVGFLEHSRGRIEERAHLQQIAEATGGQAFFPTTMKDIEASYDKVVAQIRAQYSLAYSSTNTKQDGAWRKVEIRVTRPDLKGSKILARRGYFAPYQ